MTTRQGARGPARRIGLLLAVTGAWLLALVGVVSPAAADDMAESIVVSGSVAPDGTLSITQTISFADAPPASIEQRLATTRAGLDYTQLEYEISEITATAGGQDLGPQVVTDGGYRVITVDTSEVGTDPIEISYQVRGAAVAQPEVPNQDATTQVSWRVVQGLSVAARQVRGEIALPSGTRTTDINCQAGPPAATTSCNTYASGTFEAPFPQFTDGPLGAGEVVLLTFNVPSVQVAPNQVLTQRWTLDRAFSASPLPLLVALGAALLGAGALFALHRARGADATGVKPTAVAQFEPTAAGEERFRLLEHILPGEVGTLMDERVDPIDITATIFDLAQRGHLVIHELEKPSPHSATDWSFERREGGDELHDYERTLLDAITPPGSEPVRVSQISSAVSDVVEKVQDEIYAEVAAEGWFVDRPDSVRTTWGRIGVGSVIVSLVVLGLLVAFTRFGLLGLVLVGLAVGLLWVGQQMARRTAKGTSALRGLEVLAMNLQTQPTSHVPKDDAYAEISRILPYAIVLGGWERWLTALVEADDDPGVPDPDDLGWFHGRDTWQLSDLPSTLDALVTTLEGKLYHRG